MASQYRVSRWEARVNSYTRTPTPSPRPQPAKSSRRTKPLTPRRPTALTTPPTTPAIPTGFQIPRGLPGWEESRARSAAHVLSSPAIETPQSTSETHLPQNDYRKHSNNKIRRTTQSQSSIDRSNTSRIQKSSIGRRPRPPIATTPLQNYLEEEVYYSDDDANNENVVATRRISNHENQSKGHQSLPENMIEQRRLSTVVSTLNALSTTVTALPGVVHEQYMQSVSAIAEQVETLEGKYTNLTSEYKLLKEDNTKLREQVTKLQLQIDDILGHTVN